MDLWTGKDWLRIGAGFGHIVNAKINLRVP